VDTLPWDTAIDIEPVTPVADVAPETTGPCEPAGDGVWLDWTFDGSAGWDEMDVEVPCRISGIGASSSGELAIDLECGTGGLMTLHTIEIRSNPRASIEDYMDHEVVLTYVSEPWEWSDRWLTLRHPGGGLLLALATGSNLHPWDRTMEEWYDPLGVSVVTGWCPTVSAECGLMERPGLEVSFAGESDVVFDGGYAYIGSMVSVVVALDTAWHYSVMECMDYPIDFYNVMFTFPMEG
jgi:hypothetical protein